MGKWVVEIWRDDMLIKVVETSDPAEVLKRYKNYNIRMYPKWSK